MREVPLSPDVIEAFRRQRALQAQERLCAGSAFVDSGHVFQTEIGGVVKPMRATDAFRGLARNARIATTRLHDLRHTFCSWELAGGIDPVTVASIAGHSSPTVTMQMDSHAIRATQVAAVLKIDERLARAGRKKD